MRSGEQTVPEQASIDWKKVRDRAGGPYTTEAFEFVRAGLAHTVKVVHGAGGGALAGPERHVTGQQLCNGLRDYAILRYGMLARTVLARWGILRTDDFGRIVYAMIDAGLMRKGDEDTFAHFQGVYDFDEAFSLADVF